MDTDEVLNQALTAMDAEDADLAADADDKDKGADDDKATKNAGAGDDAAGEDDDESGDSDDNSADGKDDAADNKDAKGAEGDGVDDDEEGTFTADDALEVEEDGAAAPNTDAPTDQSGIRLTQGEQDHLVKNIGDPLILNGHKLDKDGNAVDYQIKAFSSRDIPADFQFNADVDRVQASEAFNRIEQKAENIIGQYRQDMTRRQAAEFERAENQAIKDDVAALQKEGRMPKFRVKPGEVGFDEDPAAQIMDEVLKIMYDRNQKYLDESRKGKAYRHIGYEQAYDIYERTNPQRQAARAKDTAQTAEDKARKGKAERGDSNRGEAPKNIMKAAVPSGLSHRDIMAMLDDEEL